MTYIAALVYDPDGNFRGYTTLNAETNKLKSTNLWSEEELPKLNDQVARLNVGSALSAHWPAPSDPEVMALLNDPAWEPLEMVPGEAVDDDRSHWVWTQEPKIDPLTGGPAVGPDGQMIMINGELDREASVIAYKRIMVPREPIKAQVRTKKAQDIVARRRAGMS